MLYQIDPADGNSPGQVYEEGLSSARGSARGSPDGGPSLALDTTYSVIKLEPLTKKTADGGTTQLYVQSVSQSHGKKEADLEPQKRVKFMH